MMTRTILAVAWMLCFLNALAAGNSVAAQGFDEEPLKYKMERVVIFEEDKPAQYVFVLNGSVGFKSVMTLRAFIAKMRPGSIIEWRPPCDVMGEEPLRTEQEIKDFEAFCKSKKVKLVLLPSG
jgi:hypothetical protein